MTKINNDHGYYNLNELFNILNSEFHNFSIETLKVRLRWLRKEKLITNNKIGSVNLYTEEDLFEIKKDFQNRNYHLDPDSMDANYFTIAESLKLLSHTPYADNSLTNLFKDNYPDEIVLYKGILRVSKPRIFELIQTGDVTNYISVGDLARKLDIHVDLVTRRIRNGFFKDKKKIGGIHYISVKEAEEWRNEVTSPTAGYTNVDALLEIESYFNRISKNIPEHSHSLYDKWITSKISRSHGRPVTVKHIVSFGIDLYELLLKHLNGNTEIYDLDHTAVEALIALHTNKRVKKELILFYNYALTATHTNPDKKMRIERQSRKKKMQHDQNNSKEIYQPLIYQNYYNYVQNIELHTKLAIKTRSYANMWLYVIMHLTNCWRANDIIFQMPNISIENVGITEFQWFENNKLTTSQAQTIANEVYLYFHNKLANKNQAVLRFYLDPTLLLCFSTSMVICELHCRAKKALQSLRIHRNELLATFISGKKNEFTISSGHSVHKAFFGKDTELRKFSSLMMNRSTMVYFFHNTVEGPGNDSDVALELTKMTRSHFKDSTTAIYVESSNQDGTINRVSINLFNRGHFGWLYNYILKLTLNLDNNIHSLEDRTEQIKHLKSEYTPLLLDSWSEYFLNQHMKERSIIIELSKLSESQLVHLLYKIYKNEMPSKHKEGQCLNYPNCEYPSRSTCFGCDYFIPQEFLLIEAVSELKKRVTMLQNATLESVIIRESKFINSILLLLSEASKYLGNEKLRSFIAKEELNDLVSRISDRLLLN